MGSTRTLCLSGAEVWRFTKTLGAAWLNPWGAWLNPWGQTWIRANYDLGHLAAPAVGRSMSRRFTEE